MDFQEEDEEIESQLELEKKAVKRERSLKKLQMKEGEEDIERKKRLNQQSENLIAAGKRKNER